MVFKWDDINGNGVRDVDAAGIPLEPGIGGVIIYVDLNNNNMRDTGEPSTTTMFDDSTTPNENEEGMYWLTVPADVPIIIREVVPIGFVQTFPSVGFHSVNVPLGETFTGLDFGNQEDMPPDPSSVHGFKWNDINGNRQRDGGAGGAQEPGIGGVIIYVDLNNNNMRDTGEPSITTMFDNPATPNENEEGMYWLTVPSGIPLIIREVIPPGQTQTFPANALGGTPFAHDVQPLGPGETMLDIDFWKSPGWRSDRCTHAARCC